MSSLDALFDFGMCFNWMGALVGMARDELTPGEAIICDSITDAIIVKEKLDRYGIKCYHAGEDLITGEAAIWVYQEDVERASQVLYL